MAAGKKLELEFARLANIVDDRKALSVGTSEQNRAKNQSDTVIPFDRNRVILTPDGQRPDSTYINASFIEGYHNDESFIITQVCTKYRITLRIKVEASCNFTVFTFFYLNMLILTYYRTQNLCIF